MNKSEQNIFRLKQTLRLSVKYETYLISCFFSLDIEYTYTFFSLKLNLFQQNIDIKSFLDISCILKFAQA